MSRDKSHTAISITWDDVHSGILLIGLVVVVQLYPIDEPLIHLFAWVSAWVFGYYLFAKQVVPPRYRP